MYQRVYLLSLLVFLVFSAHAQTPSQVKILGTYADAAPALEKDGKVYYDMTGPSSGDGTLWVSDGTASGTIKVKDFLSEIYYFHTIPGRSEVFFLSDSNADQVDLWKTDGTNSGTVIVKTFGTQFNFSIPVEQNGKVYYPTTGPGSADADLFVSDGTTSGTFKLKDFLSEIDQFHSIPGRSELYFISKSTSEQVDLWKSDGTTNGTSIVKTFGIQREHGQPFSHDGKAYYATSGTSNDDGDLWVSDGTTNGTSKVKDFLSDIHRFHTIPNRPELFFLSYSNAGQVDLWKSNGTGGGTSIVKTFGNQDQTSFPVEHNGKVYYPTSGPNNGDADLWVSDGTTSGTQKLKDFLSEILQFHTIPGRNELYFLSTSSTNQVDLWKSDGTSSGTSIVKTFGNQTFISTAVEHNGKVYYPTSGSNNGDADLWVSDGTASGTSKLKDFLSEIYYPHAISGRPDLYFLSQSSNDQVDLWRTDGTSSGTVIVKTIGSYTTLDVPVLHGNKAWYPLSGPNNGDAALWRSNGLGSGTVLAKSHLSEIHYFHVIPNTGDLYYLSYSNADQRDLWRVNDPVLIGQEELLGMEGQVVMYPNPAQNEFHLHITEGALSGGTHVFIRNLMGQIVYSQTFAALDHLSISVPHTLSNGMYVVTVEQQHRRWTGKLQIEK